MALPTELTGTSPGDPGDPLTGLRERLCVALAGRYAVEEELGRDGAGLVFLARDRKDNRRVALRVLRPDLGSAVGAKRFLREITLASKLQHPHIVSVQDAGAVDGLLYYVMPYIDGESLRARLRREGPLPLDEALQITRDVVAALSYAHRRGVVHRDIKPENILLARGRALLGDFGVAQAVAGDGPRGSSSERLTGTGLAVGTPAYMSPELAGGSRRLDRRTDIYALGCVVYEMLGGETPYTGPTPQAVIAKQLREPVPHVRALREGLPAGVEQAVTRALAKAPADRFPTAEAFAAALSPQTGSEAALTERPIPLTPAQRLRRGRSVRVLAFVGAAMAAAAAAVLTLWHSRAAAPIAPSVATATTRRIVVAVFANQTGDPSLDPLGDIVADYLGRGLAETKLVEVIDARAEQSPDGSAHVADLTGARKLAGALGAGSVLWGSYARRGDSLAFQAELTDAATGKPVTAIQPAAGSASQQMQAVEALRQHAMVALAERFDPRLARFADVGGSHTVSYDAYREFLAGDTIPLLPTFPVGPILLAGPRPCDPSCVMGHFRRAYALDTNFTLAIVTAAFLAAWTGGCKQTDSIADALRSRHDRLPSFDRLRLDLSVAHCHGEHKKALAAIREAMIVAPRSPDLVFEYAFNARHLGYLRESIAVIEKLDRARYQHQQWYWENLLLPYHELGEHQRELELAQRLRRVRPGDLYALSWEARALVGLGRLADADARVEEAVRVPLEASRDFSLPDFFDAVGSDLRAHGYRREAKALFEQGIRWIEARPTTEQQARRADLSGLLYDAERWDEARRILKQLAAEKPDDIDSQAALGKVAAHRRDLKEVARIDRWLAGRTGPYLNGYHTFQRALLAAILGERDRAFQLYRRAVGEGAWLHFDAAHYDSDFEALRAYPPFQELTRPRN